jgi:erythromycin esterase-like protein
MPSDATALRAIRQAAQPLRDADDIAAIARLIGASETVLLGEATHGTHEFYRLRAALSRRLVTDHGFDAIAVEADWPDALRLGRYATGGAPAGGAPAGAGVGDALAGFTRFPRWMWRNEEVRTFARRLRRHNDALTDKQRRVGFFGLDLYSLRASMHAVIDHLQRTDPEAARQARRRYDCFDGLAADPQRYGQAVHFDLAPDCEREVVSQLQALAADTRVEDRDEAFYAEQNARLVVNAERYYRTIFDGRTDSWNLRDTHMADTLAALRKHLSARHGRPAKIAVWAHNSHVGDSRATEFHDRGQLNLGQLVRERPQDFGPSFLLGFTTHTGTVAAAADWDEPVELKSVRPSLPGSCERLLHDSGLASFLLPFGGAAAQAFAERRLHRAIGVIYRPETERHSHYFWAALAAQFDAVVHVDETRAVRPLDPPAAWPGPAEPETYPFGV